MKKYLVLLTVFLTVTFSRAALLSDNALGWLLDTNTEVIATGATYMWLPGSDTNMFLDDPGRNKMVDGSGTAGGGTTALWSSWDGDDSYLQFDLQSIYQVTNVALYITIDLDSAGLAGLDVETSLDATNYTFFGEWLENPTNQVDVLATVYGSTTNARYVKLTFKRVVPYPGIAGRQNWSHQHRIGEVMVYGTNVPAPATLTMLFVLGLGLFAKRRK